MSSYVRPVRGSIGREPLTRHAREAGQVTTTLALAFAIALVSIGIVGVLGLGRAVDERSQARSAADAAALAGATSLHGALPSIFARLRAPGDPLDFGGCSLGRETAVDFAARNEAALTSYCFDVANDRVEVSVQMNDAVSPGGPKAKARAVAASGMGLDRCVWPDLEPPKDPDPDPEPEPGPVPAPQPEPVPIRLVCGLVEAELLFEPGADKVSLVRLVFDEEPARLIE